MKTIYCLCCEMNYTKYSIVNHRKSNKHNKNKIKYEKDELKKELNIKEYEFVDFEGVVEDIKCWVYYNEEEEEVDYINLDYDISNNMEISLEDLETNEEGLVETLIMYWTSLRPPNNHIQKCKWFIGEILIDLGLSKEKQKEFKKWIQKNI